MEYLIDLNATNAAIRAGYSKKTAQVQSSRLLSNVMVKREIDKAKKKRAERTEITQDYVTKMLVDTVERCSQARPVIDAKGDPVMVETPDGLVSPAYTFDATNVIRGADLLGKHIGYFKEDNNQKGLLGDLPRSTVKAIMERLRGIPG